MLAVLGILVGTGSVVALLSSGQFATEHALAQFKSLGTNLLSVSIMDQADSSQSKQSAKELTLDDVATIKAVSNQIVLVAPYVSSYQSIYIAGIESSAQVVGADEKLDRIAKIKVAQGRGISHLDRFSFYCTIGAKLAKKIKEKGVNPLGNQIIIGKSLFTIIGINQPWKSNFFFYSDIDNGVMIPIEVAQLIDSNAKIDNILFRLVVDPNLVLAQDAIKKKLAAIVPQKKVEFRNPEQIIDIVGKQRKTFTLLLSSIGGISLLVGGIGVMNIMLVSVIERRQEIGIRMAIGAKRSDVMKMFIIESIILSLFGGVLGIMIGIFISWMIAFFSGWDYYFYVMPPVLGFSVSVLVGILSGFYPAMRASRLDPVEIIS